MEDDRKNRRRCWPRPGRTGTTRSEEHTSELQSQSNLVCRLLLEKKKTILHVIENEHDSSFRHCFFHYTKNVITHKAFIYSLYLRLDGCAPTSTPRTNY